MTPGVHSRSACMAFLACCLVLGCGPKKSDSVPKVTPLNSMIVAACEFAGAMTVDEASRHLLEKGFLGYKATGEGTGGGSSGGHLESNFDFADAPFTSVGILHCCDGGMHGTVGTLTVALPDAPASSLVESVNAVVESPLRAVAGAGGSLCPRGALSGKDRRHQARRRRPGAGTSSAPRARTQRSRRTLIVSKPKAPCRCRARQVDHDIRRREGIAEPGRLRCCVLGDGLRGPSRSR